LKCRKRMFRLPLSWVSLMMQRPCKLAIGGYGDGMGLVRSSLMMLAAVLAGASSMTAFAQLAGDLATLSARVVELCQAGKYAEGTEIAERCLALAEKQHGANHQEVADSLSNLGKLYRARGRAAEAEPLFKSSIALQASASALKEANELDKRALELYKSGNASEAIPLASRALELREQALPSGDDAIAESLSHLAILYQAQGQLAEAEALFKRALALREQAPIKQIGKITLDFRPQLAESLSNLAAVYQAKGRLTEAEPLYQRAIAIYDEVAFHFLCPDLAESLSNLAALYKAQGRLIEAEPLFKRALAIYEEALPPGHPRIATSLSNLAALYKAQGRVGDAEPLQERALQMRRHHEPR
jgi:tetratricopeptide (TPR) repeat protein